MENGYRVVKLLRNRIYPTYQLFAKMANRKTNTHDGLTIGALTVMQWLRRRMGEDAPKSWESLPEPGAYRFCAEGQIASIHINQGYVIDIVSLPEQGMWSLQITEPDLGSDPGNPEQKRPPIPGRVIETNVAFLATDTELECGFKTVISDMENEKQPAEVYRLACIRRLANNPDFGLRQIVSLSENAIEITTERQVKELTALWRDTENQLPIVVFTKPVSEAPRQALEPAPSFLPLPTLQPRQVIRNRKQEKPFLQPSTESRKGIKRERNRAFPGVGTQPVRKVLDPPYDVSTFAKSCLSFCRTYVMGDAVFGGFLRHSGVNAQAGDIVLLEPAAFGGEPRTLSLPSSISGRENTLAELKRFIKDYPREKTIAFGHVAFLSASRERLEQKTDEALRMAGETEEIWRQRLAQLRSEWTAVLAEKDAEIAALTERMGRQTEFQAQLEQEKTMLRARQEQELARAWQEASDKEAVIAYLRRKLSQPEEHAKIADWAERQFGEHLV